VPTLVQQPGDSTITWNILKADTKIPLKAEEFRLPELPGWVVTDRPAPNPLLPG
jgi:hypothetical protein